MPHSPKLHNNSSLVWKRAYRYLMLKEKKNMGKNERAVLPCITSYSLLYPITLNASLGL